MAGVCLRTEDIRGKKNGVDRRNNPVCQCLIKLYEVNPCFFDVSSKNCHNRNVKRNAMERIAKELSSSRVHKYDFYEPSS